jgi:hypothetical protein
MNDEDRSQLGRLVPPLDDALYSEASTRAHSATEGRRLVQELLENYELNKLYALVVAMRNPGLWPIYRDAGAVDLFIKLVCERDTFDVSLALVCEDEELI